MEYINGPVYQVWLPSPHKTYHTVTPSTPGRSQLFAEKLRAFTRYCCF